MRTVFSFVGFIAISGTAFADGVCVWDQWGGSQSHDGQLCRPAQEPRRAVSQVIFDQFAADEQADRGGPLFVHYQAALNDVLGNVYMMAKEGSFNACDPPGSFSPFPCGMFDVSTQVWTEKGYRWKHGKLEEVWSFPTDWKPNAVWNFFEPMFQPALWGPFIYIPAGGGTVWQVIAPLGIPIRRINPFGEINPNRYVSGGVTADKLGNVYWNVVTFDPDSFVHTDSWLVKTNVFGQVKKVAYTGLVPGAPMPGDDCLYFFEQGLPEYPPPPNPDGTPAQPPSFPCAIQRPSYNMTPAIGADGTIYTGSRDDFNAGYSQIIALRPDLSLKWARSLRGAVNDGCFETIDCPPWAVPGVDPFSNQPPELTLDDASSSTPVVLPDGNVVYGALDFYSVSRGSLVELNGRDGHVMGSFPFGWDITPAVYSHDHTYSLVLKNNDYRNGIYKVTQLGKDFDVEWQYQNQSTQRCHRDASGGVTCEDDPDHPTGFEWCVNAPAIDSQGTVYLTSEDGYAYAIDQGGTVKSTYFLDINDGAAYTPLSLDAKGRIYTLANGVLTVLGN